MSVLAYTILTIWSLAFVVAALFVLIAIRRHHHPSRNSAGVPDGQKHHDSAPQSAAGEQGRPPSSTALMRAAAAGQLDNSALSVPASDLQPAQEDSSAGSDAATAIAGQDQRTMQDETDSPALIPDPEAADELANEVVARAPEAIGNPAAGGSAETQVTTAGLQGLNSGDSAEEPTAEHNSTIMSQSRSRRPAVHRDRRGSKRTPSAEVPDERAQIPRIAQNMPPAEARLRLALHPIRRTVNLSVLLSKLPGYPDRMTVRVDGPVGGWRIRREPVRRHRD
jgi:hypothetical protein